MQRNNVLILAIIISLIIGGGGVYAFTYNQLTTLTNDKAELLVQISTKISEKNQLQNQFDSLIEEKNTLESLVSTYRTANTSLQRQVNSLNSEIIDLNNKYNLLAGVIDKMHSNNWTRTMTYNITNGEEMTQLFILDRFGIVWEVVIYFSGTSLEVKYYYWYMEQRYFVSSTSKSLIIQDNPDITYYGPQKFIYGTISIDTSMDYRVANRVWFDYNTLTQFPEIRINGRFSLDVDES